MRTQPSTPELNRYEKLVLRDAWNLAIRHVWSRRIRRLWLKRLLGCLGQGAVVCLHVTLLGPRGVSLGDRSVVNANSVLDGRGGLSIGHDVDIAMNCQIWTLDHDPNSPTHGTRERPVTIGDHAWIASGSIILGGVSIGRGAVVAAGSVVTKDVPDLAIVAGSPARVIGTRDNELTYRLSFGGRFR